MRTGKQQKWMPSTKVAIFGVCIATFAASGYALSAEYTMRINHTFGMDSFPDRALKEFEKAVEERTNDQVEVRLYSSGELGQELEQYDLMQTGALEAALLGGQVLSSVTPEYSMFETPYLWRDQEHLRKVWDGPIGDEVSQALLDRKGIRIIGAWNRGARNLTTTDTKVTSPDDLAGLKIRTTQNPVHVAAWEALGAVPTPMPFGDVFMSLRQGVIDGQENPVDLVQSASFPEVQEYLHLTQHVRSIGWLGVSDVWFQTLPEDVQTIILEEASAAMDYNDELLASEEQKILQELSEAMTVVPESEIDIDAFRARLEDLPERFADTWKEGVYDQIVATE